MGNPSGPVYFGYLFTVISIKIIIDSLFLYKNKTSLETSFLIALTGTAPMAIMMIIPFLVPFYLIAFRLLLEETTITKFIQGFTLMWSCFFLPNIAIALTTNENKFKTMILPYALSCAIAVFMMFLTKYTIYA